MLVSRGIRQKGVHHQRAIHARAQFPSKTRAMSVANLGSCWNARHMSSKKLVLEGMLLTLLWSLAMAME